MARRYCARLKIGAVVLAIVSITACSRSSSIVVGSKNFTEQIILGEMAAQQIERKLHLPVERRLGLGGTLLAHQALVKGQIDLYPEYTGTASLTVLKQKIDPDAMRVYMQTKDAYRERFHLVWLPPLGFDDTFAMVVRAKDAARLASPTLSAAVLAREWRLGVGYEFLTRADGLRRLDEVYPLKWSGAPETMDLGLLYQGLAHDQVDMIAANSTDGTLTEAQYRMLADDKKAFPPYNACFVARQEMLENRPGVETALTMLSGRLSDEAMRNLNREVDVEHKQVTAVVRDFLAAQP